MAHMNQLLGDSKLFWDRVQWSDGCWLWRLSCDQHGYGRYASGSRVCGAHRIAWMLANKSDIPSGLVIMHRCDTPRCCNPAHLRLGTQDENIADRERKGRSAVGRQARFPRPDTAKITGGVSVSEKLGLASPRSRRTDRSLSECLDEALRKKAARDAKRRARIPAAGI